MYSLASYLLRPFVLMLLLLALAIVFLWRGRKEPRFRWLVLVFGILVVTSTPAFGWLAVGSLEWGYPPLEDRPENVQALVVLGGGVIGPDRMRSRPELDTTSLYRCLETVRQYRQGGPCPVLVSGGKPDPEEPGPACAELMAAFLIDLGVRPADVIVEAVSRTTYENAVESRKILEERGINRIVLVTEATHLHRATLCFRKQGLTVMPCGSRYRKTEFKPSVYEFLPALTGLEDVDTASHEWIGLAWYQLAGRV